MLAILVALFLTPLAAPRPAWAEARIQQRPVVARSLTDDASFLRREAPGKEWQIVTKNENLHAGDLLLAWSDAALASTNGAVQVAVNGDMNGAAPIPVFETAVVLNSSRGVDLDLTLERGRIEITNTRDKGEATVRIRLRGQSGELVLAEPGTRVVVEMFSRWPKGVPFNKKAEPEASPALAVFLLVTRGEARLETAQRAYSLKAPPGPALVQGDTMAQTEPEAVYLKELPPWARGAETPQGKEIKAVAARFRALAVKKGIGGTMDDLLKSDDKADRRFAIFLLAAIDDLPRLSEAVVSSRPPDVWDSAVHAMRRWIGREPGQDMKLYQHLIDRRGFKPVEAETVLQLLHSFSDEDVAEPETYQTLIGLLDNEQLLIRGLANWHLVRLVPGGKNVGFNPSAPKEERAKAVQAWHKLLPSGKLPSDLKEKEEK